ncbi:MAG TPA: SulP family inorganic anion transporter [Ilumatobacteraceae bacterium]|nr:SulP family inorganic anion transporter [Ilumatobacteraceae bacterium]
MSALARHVPGVASLRGYERRWLRSDLVAGIVLAAILVPQGMAYAELAGLPPVTGLYTTVACLVGYALMGPSKILVLGPDSSLGPLIFAAIAPLVVAGDDPAAAIALAGMLAILVGLIEVGLGVGKLGFVADLLSSEVQVGYMNGLAIVIIVGQLPKLSGFSTDADTFVDEVREFVTNFDQRDGAALAVGLVTLSVLVGLPRLTRTVPAVLVAVVGATIATSLFDLDVSTVGTLPEGLPTPELPWTELGDVLPLLVAAVGITLVSLTDTIALSTSFNARRGEPVEPNQEMIGVGAANVAAGFFQGFAVSASSSRTAVAEQSGAKTQLAGVIGAGIVVLLLVAFNGLLADLPNAALAAIVIAAALSLLDVSLLTRIWRFRPSAVLLSLVASAGVIFLGVLEGIVVAIVLSILLFFHRNWWPHGEVLGRVAGREGWHSGQGGGDLVELPDTVVFRWEAPLFFANAGIFATQVRALVRERRPRWVILQCEAITDIDVTAAAMLERLDDELNEQGVHIAFVELRTRLHDLVHDYGLLRTLDRDHFYSTIDDALADIDRSRGGDEPAP